MYEFKYKRIHIPTNTSEIITSCAPDLKGIISFIDKHNHFYYCGNLLWFYEFISFEELTLEVCEKRLKDIKLVNLTPYERELMSFMLDQKYIPNYNLLVSITIIVICITIMLIAFIK